MADALAIAVYGVHYWSTGHGLPAGEVVVTWYVERHPCDDRPYLAHIDFVRGCGLQHTGPCPIERRADG